MSFAKLNLEWGRLQFLFSLHCSRSNLVQDKLLPLFSVKLNRMFVLRAMYLPIASACFNTIIEDMISLADSLRLVMHVGFAGNLSLMF